MRILNHVSWNFYNLNSFFKKPNVVQKITGFINEFIFFSEDPQGDYYYYAEYGEEYGDYKEYGNYEETYNYEDASEGNN